MSLAPLRVNAPQDRPHTRPLSAIDPAQLRVCFVASQRPEAQSALRRLAHIYGNSPFVDADVVVALGGDGLMLDALRRSLDNGPPVFGMNRGTIGFLMNDFSDEDLPHRLTQAEAVWISPLLMQAQTSQGHAMARLAINEASLLRQTHQTARLRIRVDGAVRMEELACDGVLVATPAGSTAYNYSAHGPILPIDANLLALTPISAFRPRRWRGALLNHDAEVEIETLEPEFRPVAAVADNQEVRDVVRVTIREARDRQLCMLFDPNRPYAERVLREQFES